MTRRYLPIKRKDWQAKPIASLLRLPVQFYGYTLSFFMGRWCRHLPTCSEYMDQALAEHGAWAGGWIGFSRVCRCRPRGTNGFDPVPAVLPDAATSFTPWRYGRWATVEPAHCSTTGFICEGLERESPDPDKGQQPR